MKTAYILLAVALCASAVAANPGEWTIHSEHMQAAFGDMHGEIDSMLEPFKGGRGLLQASNVPSFQDFMKGMYGNNWASFVPPSWTSNDFNWGSLDGFNLGDQLQNFINGTTFSKLVADNNLTTIVSAFRNITGKICAPWTFRKTKAIKPFCAGPKVIFTLLPKTCILDEYSHSVVCAPAKLVYVKKPGQCVHSGFTATVWKDKLCRLSKAVGVDGRVLLGGKPYAIPLPDFFHKKAPSPSLE